MIRVTLSFDAVSENAAVDALNEAATKLEDGYTTVWLSNDEVHDGVMNVETLCEYCDGTGEISTGTIGVDDITQPCFNCSGPDYDAMREGK